MANACLTRETASFTVIINRVISGSVMVIGIPFCTCSMNRGTAEPLDATRLPKRVTQISVLLCCCDFWIATFSMYAFVMPMAEVGYTALSVERQTTFFTCFWMAARSRFSLPAILVFTASIGKLSQEGTCFIAAA